MNPDDDDEQPIEPSLVDEYTAALLRGELDSPDEWLFSRKGNTHPSPQALAVLRSVDLLVRCRNALEHSSVLNSTVPSVAPGPLGTTPAMSTVSATESEPADGVLNDRQWLAAHNLEPIGRLDVPGGGMGFVGLAWHTEMKREVVLKVAKGESNELRFQREIRVHAKLGGHTNIAVTRTPLRYRQASVLVVDYVQGLNLKRRVQLLGPMDWRESCDCIRQAAVGLSHAAPAGGNASRRQVVEPRAILAGWSRQSHRLGPRTRPRGPGRVPDRNRPVSGHSEISAPRSRLTGPRMPPPPATSTHLGVPGTNY